MLILIPCDCNRIKSNPGNIIYIDCDPSTYETQCYIAQPIQILAGDRLKLNSMSNEFAQKVLEFSVTYEAKIPFIPHSVFELFPNLEQLKLSTGIKMLHYNDFENAWNLRNLTLSDNKLEHIPQSTFSQAKNLVELNLDGNEILHLDNDAFNGLDKLYYLSLNKNRIITLKSFVFVGAPHLSDLRLEYNEIETLEPGVFDLPDLMFLYLSHNQLKTISDDCFANTQLIGLDLRSNQLTHIGNGIYNLRSLRKLLLTNNKQINDLNVTRINGMNRMVDLTT